MITREAYQIKGREESLAVKALTVRNKVKFKDLSDALGKYPGYMSSLLYPDRKNKISISRKALDTLAELVTGNKNGLDEYFAKVCIQYGRHRKENANRELAEEETPGENQKAKATPQESKYGMFKPGNGYRYVFSLNGEEKAVYGMTHNECYKKAKELTEKHEAPKTEPPIPDGQITMKLSDTDAVILSERLSNCLEMTRRAWRRTSTRRFAVFTAY